MSSEEITLQIMTPKGEFTETFSQHTHLHDVILSAIQRMQLSGYQAFDLKAGDRMLTPHDQPLSGFNLAEGTRLELVQTGAAA